MSGRIVDKERENNSPRTHKSPTNNMQSNKNSTSQWVKARQHGKSCKEFTALHMCQEIQAHEGSIWTLRFSPDARFLASAGEDTVIHIWEVQECEVASTRPPDDLNASVNSTTHHHHLARNGSDHRPPLAEITPLLSRRKGKIYSKKKGNSIPDYVHVPETVFTLLETPVCSFRGHQDDVLDLSWSRTQLLLSSSMDKTVRLWDMETESCLKMFAHSDYVTCIQFNPVDDDQFISGSLDAKVRIWSISNRQVVDWTDLNEMVTAASYTPDGQGAVVGSHKGICRFYDTSGGKLEQKDQIELKSRKKKAQPNKITGIQFSPENPSEVLVTSADSRLRILDGSHLIHKFRGVRNTSSQILASFSPDGKYVISPSEDSQVYIWKYEVQRGASRKSTITTHSHEHFQCREVSVAIPWPGSIKTEPPIVEVHSKRHSKRSIQQPLSVGYEETLSKRSLPPLPKKNNMLERASSCPDEDLSKVSRTESGMGVGESFSSSSSSSSAASTSNSSSRYTLSSPSHNTSHSWSNWFDGVSHGGNTMQATAWGLAVVTAGLGGALKTYQNFGLPLKVSRQSHLFRDLT
ncbi:hypothetical protein LguiB_015649 [Lonicera macranthoides]